ncbi:hypothetical protein GDO86_019661 [Hymenochirus boettgeri]|uniref:Olfactory receptor n=1 Tax=Hymenochirus boettgeri TaxID=247094 RepID=A0A8T2IGS1_9PIPI|nr:hypothetical protein GDO86_019661 [Hymenochirus boettgeri]
MANQSTVSEFIFIGFPGLPQNFHIPVSVVIFLLYSISLVANSTVMILILVKRPLHQPMYIIIGNLALSDLLFDTLTLPKIIAKYWFGAGSISFYGCFFQMFWVHCLGSVDSLIIMLMAIDRYVAICKPLRYHSIITNRLVFFICYLCWVLAALISAGTTVLTIQLPYCGPNNIKNCFCTFTHVTQLACTNTSTNIYFYLFFILAMTVLLVPLAIILLSYVLIIMAITLSSQKENWKKAFYTCTTHLFVIGLYYIPRVFTYVSTQARWILDADLSVLLLCLYTFIPHAANPIIYCLRTKEMKDILGNVFRILFKKTKSLK